MNINRQEIRTGLLVVVSLAILITVTLYLGSPGVFIPQKSFVIYIENANGVKTGADVALAGRKVGQVIKLYSPVPESERPAPNLETKMEIKVIRSALIYRKVRCVLSSTGLLGEYFVDFAAGQEASGLAPENTVFVCERPQGLDQAVPMMLAALDPVVKKATETLGSLQKTSDNLTRMTDPNGEIEKTLGEFRQFGANLKTMSGEGGSLKMAIDNVAQLTGPNGKVQEAMGNLAKLTGEGSSLTLALKNAETFTGNLANNGDIDATMRNARRATDALNKTIGDLQGRFNAIAGNLEQATDTVKRQPWRLIWPSTKKYENDERKTAERKPATPAPRRRR